MMYQSVKAIRVEKPIVIKLPYEEVMRMLLRPSRSPAFSLNNEPDAAPGKVIFIFTKMHRPETIMAFQGKLRKISGLRNWVSENNLHVYDPNTLAQLPILYQKQERARRARSQTSHKR